VDVPEPPGILVVDRLHERFVELVVTERETVLLKLLREVTLMVECAATPGAVATVDGLAETPKSWMWKTTVTEWERLPLTPVTFRR